MSLDQIHSLPPAVQDAILNLPALRPPNGTVSNFDNPPNGNSLTSTFTALLLAIGSLAVLLRAYCRAFVLRRVQLEDFLALSGYCMFVCFAYCIYAIIRGTGIFVHQWDIRIRDLEGLLYFIHLNACFYAISVMLLKVAILLEWNRLFAPRGITPYFSRICYALLAVNVLFYSASVIASALSCRPYRRIWDRTIPGTCINTMILDITSSAFNVLSNIVILALPQNIIWRLKMTRTRKIGMSLVFAIGILATTASIYRLVATAIYITSPDITYTISSVGSGCLAEMVCMILVFCIPSFPKIFRDSDHFSRIVRSLRSWRQSSRSGSEESSKSGVAIPQPERENPGKSNGYQMIDDNPIPLTNLPHLSLPTLSPPILEDRGPQSSNFAPHAREPRGRQFTIYR